MAAIGTLVSAEALGLPASNRQIGEGAVRVVTRHILPEREVS
jgi:hypothetical protein